MFFIVDLREDIWMAVDTDYTSPTNSLRSEASCPGIIMFSNGLGMRITHKHAGAFCATGRAELL